MDEQTQKNTDNAAPAPAPTPMRRRLGRGLNALLGTQGQAEPVPQSVEASQDSEIAVDQIDRNPFQPRQEFEANALTELADSISKHGVLQPVLVRPVNGRFQLIAGERRWRAAKQAGLKKVPCRVMELDDKQICEVAIEENLKRKDLGVLEKAEAFREYLGRFKSTLEELAGRLSMSRSALNNYLRLLELPDGVKKLLRAEKITNGHARALLPLEEKDQLALCKRIERESLSVRKTEQAVKEIAKARKDELLGVANIVPFSADVLPADEDPAVIAARETSKTELTPHLRSLQDQLRSLLGVKVELQLSGQDKGKIMIPFASTQEFEALLRRLRNAA